MYSSLLMLVQGANPISIKRSETRTLGREFFRLDPLEGGLLLEARRALSKAESETKQLKRKALIEEAYSFLGNPKGLSLYIIEGNPKLIYHKGQTAFLPVSVPTDGLYSSRQDLFTFDLDLASAKHYVINGAPLSSTICFPIKRGSSILGIFVAQAEPGKHLLLDTGRYAEKDGSGKSIEERAPLKPRDDIAFTIQYFYDLSQHFSSLMGSWFDDLTGLLNRDAFKTEIVPSIKRWAEKGKKFALVFLDLDRFKKINDRFGHSAGDEILAEVGKIFRVGVRGSTVLSDSVSKYPSDIAGRYGGDEFIAVIPIENDEDAIIPARRLLEEISKLHKGEGNKRINLSCSMGVLGSKWLAEKLGKPDFNLLETLDVLLYKSKVIKPGTITYYAQDGSIRQI